MKTVGRIALPLLLLSIVLIATAHAAGSASQGQIGWGNLTPGSDWSNGILHQLFPASSSTATPGLGGEQSVIGVMLGDFNGLAMLIATAFVAYSTIVEIHRGAETGRVLSEKTSSWSPVRMGFAAIMMIPLASGFSVGQESIMTGAGWGIGGADYLYNQAVDAIGPQGLPITTPHIPNVEPLVADLIDSDVCRDLINDAADNPQEIPPPAAISGGSGSSNYIVLSFNAASNAVGSNPTCGAYRINTGVGAKPVDGQSVNMDAADLADVQYVLGTTIDPAAQTAADTWWSSREDSAFTPLWATYVKASNQLTSMLTQSATNEIQSLSAASGTQGNLDTTEQQMKDLGWAGAGAYFWKIAQMNGVTSSLTGINLATPSKASFSGIGPSIRSDIAPAIIATTEFMQEVKENAATNDSAHPPSGIGSNAGSTKNGTLKFVFTRLAFNQDLLNTLSSDLSPVSGGVWQDPFVTMAKLGSKMVGASETALVTVGALRAASAKGLWARLFRVTPEGGILAAAAKVVDGGVLGSFIFVLCMALLVPGLILAFVMPMIPLTMWIAGVGGWFILVVEAIIATPLWMLAHMTYQGEGFHGRAGYGYSMMFNVLFRPVLMLFGLMLAYWLFSVMSWLVFETFNLASDFVLQQGYVVTNTLGVIVLLAMLVTIEMTLAVMSFKLISQFPYQVMKWAGLEAGSRVDMEDFALGTTTLGSRAVVGEINRNYVGTVASLAAGEGLSGAVSRRLGNRPSNGRNSGQKGIQEPDKTLDAGTDVIPPAE